MGLYLILPLTLLAIVLVIGAADFTQMLHAQISQNLLFSATTT